LDGALDAVLEAVFDAVFAAAGAGRWPAARGAVERAAVFLAVVPVAAVLPDAALLATIGPRPFVAHAVVVDKWGRQ
jgi:ABC-type nitrate/sulfonate/bicarbonate transport system permease component